MNTLGPAPAANADDRTLTVDAAFVALREILNERLDADSLALSHARKAAGVAKSFGFMGTDGER